MTDSTSSTTDFLSQLTSIVEANITNEHFGVSELADEMNMSRSNLLRKVKVLTKLSVSQFIREIRLKNAMQLLRKTSLNVSEVSHQVGFGSTSYFIKCFREYYGYPPGEVGKRDEKDFNPIQLPKKRVAIRRLILGLVGLFLATGGMTYYIISKAPAPLEKSIAVLPFKNDSDDASNLYLINGLMESTLNNLQKIEDLRVISRTSTEKYRTTSKSIPDMANELNVNYFVDGSGQKIGDRILLNIQLIDAKGDRSIWSKQYRSEVKDIFELQQEIAKNITEEIKAILTPAEVAKINKIPTDNLEAYDNYLKGQEQLNQSRFIDALSYFQKAIELDPKFALAYANSVFAFYYLDLFQIDKKYTAEVGIFADKAMLYDPKLGNSLVAKALSFMYKKEYEQAAPYLEKAAEYYPNSAEIINLQSDLYNNYLPNTGKYLEYALKGIKLDVGTLDSVTVSYSYLNLANALIQTGFVDEANKQITKSLALNPDNFYSKWVQVFILFAKDQDANRAKNSLIKILKEDTSAFIMLEEIGKVCYLMRDYEEARAYFNRFLEIRDAQQLDLFRHESLKFAFVYSKVGEKEKASEYLKVFKAYADQDKTIYQHINLAGYYAYLGQQQQAIDEIKLFLQEDNFQYWVLLFDGDPIADQIKDHPEFKPLMKQLKDKFWKSHEALRLVLEDKGLI